MKRLMYFVLSLALAVCSCTREADEDPLYLKYALRQDITVAQLNGFRLNDSVKVDVVILVADDSASWQSMKREFDIRTSEGVTSWLGNIDNPRQRVKRSEVPLWRAMAVHDDHTIAFYRIATAEEFDALREYQLTMTENNTLAKTKI